MSGKKGGKGGGGTIVIKRIEEGGHGHHGGAWKVAYADFVTAMMAFFLLMWLLNATSEEQRRGVADYFAPTNVFGRSLSGAGQPFGGSSMTDDSSQVARAGTPSAVPAPRPQSPDDDSEDIGEPYRDRLPEGGQHPQPHEAGGQARQPGPRTDRAAVGAEAVSAVESARRGEASVAAEAARAEAAAFDAAAAQIRQAIEADARIAEFGRQLAIDSTPEGLRIQLVDEERRPMFALGGAAPNDAARLLVQKLAPILQSLPNAVSIAGHTDAAPFRGTGRTNFDLSSDRANSVRRLLSEAGLPDARIRSITGNADRDLLLPAEPMAASNRRIAIVLLRDVPLPGDAPRRGAAPAPAPAPASAPAAAPATPAAPRARP